MGVNQYLIVASHNTKVKKFSSIAIPLFGLLILIGVMQYHHGCIKIQFRVLGIAWTKK
jgi:hypothetical protein